MKVIKYFLIPGIQNEILYYIFFSKLKLFLSLLRSDFSPKADKKIAIAKF